MKKLTILFLLIPFVAISQNEKRIYANSQNNVFLHFKSPIQNGIVGNNDFVFIFNKKNDSKMGVLKILNEKSKPTNILITTKDGLIYSYILEYKNEIYNYNFFIKTKEALNYVEEEKVEPIKIVELEKKKIGNTDIDEIKKDTIYRLSNIKNVQNLYLYNKETYFKKTCSDNIDNKSFYFKSLVASNGLRFQLLDIKYNHDELYFYYEIKNKRLVDLDIDYMTFEITSKSSKKRSSSQAIEIKPIYTFQSPKVVKGNSTIRFVAVFKKFTISKKKVFLTTLKEKNGERDLNLSIFHKQVNNPNL